MCIQKQIFTVWLLFSVMSVWSIGTVWADEKTYDNPPEVPFKYAYGKDKFQELCSSCHGEWGYGTDKGPPLMHVFYKPSHHGDRAFYMAALNGVRAHHWQFGDMPPVPGATTRDLDVIVPFVRWLQRENGIYK